jgi:hypothetical protein
VRLDIEALAVKARRGDDLAATAMTAIGVSWSAPER